MKLKLITLGLILVTLFSKNLFAQEIDTGDSTAITIICNDINNTNGDGPCPSPSPEVSPSPEPSPSPVPCEETREGCPSPTPESSPAPREDIGLGVNGPDCNSNSFHTELKVKVGGVGQSGIKVKFAYKSETKEATTNADGIAGVDFEFRGNGEITATSDGHPSQTIGVESKKDCPAGGAVLGETSEGQVLGVMAETGTATGDLFTLLFALGSGLVGTGISRYGKKN